MYRLCVENSKHLRLAAAGWVVYCDDHDAQASELFDRKINDVIGGAPLNP